MCAGSSMVSLKTRSVDATRTAPAMPTAMQAAIQSQRLDMTANYTAVARRAFCLSRSSKESDDAQSPSARDSRRRAGRRVLEQGKRQHDLELADRHGHHRHDFQRHDREWNDGYESHR